MKMFQSPPDAARIIAFEPVVSMPSDLTLFKICSDDMSNK